MTGELVEGIAFIDEAGEKGFSRNITFDRDNGIALVAAILVPKLRLAEFSAFFESGYRRFVEAAPPGATLHFTDAFKSGNEQWAAVARVVREEFFDAIITLEIPVVYDARRLRLERLAFEQSERLRTEAAAANRHSRYRLDQRVDARRLEETLFQGLVVKLDALARDYRISSIDIVTDSTDLPILSLCKETLDKLSSLSHRTTTNSAWDIQNKRKVYGHMKIEISAPFAVDIDKVVSLRMGGKSDVMILVADSVVNSLYRHLRELNGQARLNAPSSISGWPLAQRVYGCRPDAFEDDF